MKEKKEILQQIGYVCVIWSSEENIRNSPMTQVCLHKCQFSKSLCASIRCVRVRERDSERERPNAAHTRRRTMQVVSGSRSGVHRSDAFRLPELVRIVCRTHTNAPTHAFSASTSARVHARKPTHTRHTTKVLDCAYTPVCIRTNPNLSLSRALSFSRVLSRSRSLSLSRSLAFSLSLAFSRSLALSRALSLSRSLSIHRPSHSLNRLFYLSVSSAPLLSMCRCPSLTLTLSLREP
jgi:hypothetical protein